MDDGPMMGGSTTNDLPGDTGELPSGSTGIEPGDGSSEGGFEGTSTGAVEDDGTDSTGDGDDESTGSTGVMDESSTGEEEALSVDDLLPGDLVVTEVMYNPSCTGDACEWIEILNTTGSTVNLVDLYIQDNDYNAGNQGRITTDVILEPGELAVIARGVSSWPYMFEPDAIYGPNPGLNNGSPDRVVLRNSTEILDETCTFFLDGEQGVAWSLTATHLDSVSNDTSNFWCPAVAELPAAMYTEFGSPGVMNPSC